MSDVVSTVSTAISLASRLKKISKNIEDAEYKNLLSDLSLELAEAKTQITTLVSEHAEMKEIIQALTSATGKLCPKCHNRTFEIISTKPHPIFGEAGAKLHDYKCSGCGFAESKMINA